METWEPSAMQTDRPFHFQPSGRVSCNCWAVSLARVRSTAVGRRERASQELAVWGEQGARPEAARWARRRAPASRPLGSSLRAWLRKPQMVGIGLNSRSRKRTPCSSRAARILARLREAAKGRPWSRAKRARTSSRVVIR
jgi:hypothetical protein